jgi:hypothetical protein
MVVVMEGVMVVESAYRPLTSGGGSGGEVIGGGGEGGGGGRGA